MRFIRDTLLLAAILCVYFAAGSTFSGLVIMKRLNVLLKGGAK